MKHKHILWDFDGTLAYRDGMWTGTLIEILRTAEPDISVTRDQLRPHLRKGFPWHKPQVPHTHIRDAAQWWQALLPAVEQTLVVFGLSAARAAELAAQVPAQFCNPENWQLFEDTISTLTALSETGWSHSILSNHVPELPDIVNALGISNFFTHIHTSAVMGFEKPHENAFRIALQPIPDNSVVWMVGDNPIADIRGAQQLGIPAVLVRQTDPTVQHQCPSLIELVEIIESDPVDSNNSGIPR
ncbi:MAG: HAD-IA family hydrolase [Sedimentisphaerales bacterium]|nr:HAD-IA family hydrolase [Sedimentisphaerales bacterium]